MPKFLALCLLIFGLARMDAAVTSESEKLSDAMGDLLASPGLPDDLARVAAAIRDAQAALPAADAAEMLGVVLDRGAGGHDDARAALIGAIVRASALSAADVPADLLAQWADSPALRAVCGHLAAAPWDRSVGWAHADACLGWVLATLGDGDAARLFAALRDAQPVAMDLVQPLDESAEKTRMYAEMCARAETGELRKAYAMPWLRPGQTEALRRELAERRADTETLDALRMSHATAVQTRNCSADTPAGFAALGALAARPFGAEARSLLGAMRALPSTDHAAAFDRTAVLEAVRGGSVDMAAAVLDASGSPEELQVAAVAHAAALCAWPTLAALLCHERLADVRATAEYVPPHTGAPVLLGAHVLSHLLEDPAPKAGVGYDAAPLDWRAVLGVGVVLGPSLRGLLSAGHARPAVLEAAWALVQECVGDPGALARGAAAWPGLLGRVLRDAPMLDADAVALVQARVGQLLADAGGRPEGCAVAAAAARTGVPGALGRLSDFYDPLREHCAPVVEAAIEDLARADAGAAEDVRRLWVEMAV